MLFSSVEHNPSMSFTFSVNGKSQKVDAPGACLGVGKILKPKSQDCGPTPNSQFNNWEVGGGSARRTISDKIDDMIWIYDITVVDLVAFKGRAALMRRAVRRVTT